MKGSADAFTWCRERLNVPDEDLALAALFAPRRQRDAVTAVAALYVELEAIATRARDLNVARIKLAWWREEFDRLEENRPEHPATRRLGAEHPRAPLPGLRDLLDGLELALLEGPVTDLGTAELRAERGMARLAVVLAALAARENVAEAKIRQAGRSIGLARTLSSPSLDDDARAAVAAAARDGLRDRLPIAPLRVLAALAWRRTCVRSGPGRGGGRVIVAWRAARGRLPRAMRAD